MAIYYDKLNAKLDAINNKDIAGVVAEQVIIPHLALPYDSTALQGWLDKKKNFLDDAKVYTEQEINNFMNTIYNRQTPQNKQLADKILNGEPYSLEGLSDNVWEDMVLFVLYMWITTP